MTMFLVRILPPSMLVLAVAGFGCGGGQGHQTGQVEVKGKVTYKGRPVPGGMVVFLAKDNFRGVGPIQRDGSYSLKCPVGQVKAAVVTHPPTEESMKDGNRPAVRDVPMPPGVDPRSLPPGKYDRFETSGLSFEVKEGGHTIDIPLTD